MTFDANHFWTIDQRTYNFTLLKVGDGAAVNQALLSEGIITRPMAGYGLGEWLRISIGTEAENDRCLAALKKIL